MKMRPDGRSGGLWSRRAIRFTGIVSIAICALALMGGCTMMSAGADAVVITEGPSAALDRMLIRRAWMDIEAPDPIETAERATEITAQAGGHVLASSAVGDRRVSLTLRIPNPRLDETLDALSELGEVKQWRLSSEDVTEQVIDTEAHLQNLIVTRDRLRSHLDRTTTVEEIIAVERELARVQSEIDSLEGRLAHLRSGVALSTVELTVVRATVLGPLGHVGRAMWWGVSKLFVWR
jgi:Domain of unknown function (DUF4349)